MDTSLAPSSNSSSSSTNINATAIPQRENGRCFNSRAPLDGPPLFHDGNVTFQAHDVGWIVCIFFTLVACAASFWLINKHLKWYTNKKEQRYIVRILFMVPLYAVVSTLSFVLSDHATALLLVRDGYEGIVLVSFFYLLLTYLSPDPETQRTIFRLEGLSKVNDAAKRKKGEKPRRWFFPLGAVKWKPADGMYFLQLMKWLVLQYIVVRPGCTLAAVVLNYLGLYCEESWSPKWGHVWLSTIVSISVTVAMYCLVQLYLPVAPRLASKRPVLKLFAIKAVVFLTFWQSTFLGVLATFKLVHDTPYMTAEDINVGWGAILETLEMALFAFLHIRAFSYKPYRPAPLAPSETPPLLADHDHDQNDNHDQDRHEKHRKRTRPIQKPLAAHYAPDGTPLPTPRLRALAHAFDFRETWREVRDGWVYGWRRARGREVDRAARREMWFEGAFGGARGWDAGGEGDEKEKEGGGGDGKKKKRYGGGLPDDQWPERRADAHLYDDVDAIEEVDLDREPHAGFYPGGGFVYRGPEEGGGESGSGRRRVRSGEQGSLSRHFHPRDRSWWRGIYDRISTSRADEPDTDEHDGYTPPPQRNRDRSRLSSADRSRSRPRAPEDRTRLIHDAYDEDEGPARDLYEERERLVRETLDDVPDYEFGARGGRYEYDDAPPQSLIRKYRASRPTVQEAYDPYVPRADRNDSHPGPGLQGRAYDPPLVPRIIMSSPPDARSSVPPSSSQSHYPSSADMPSHLFRGTMTTPSNPSLPSSSQTHLTSAESRARAPTNMRYVGAGRTVQLTMPTLLGPAEQMRSQAEVVALPPPPADSRAPSPPKVHSVPPQDTLSPPPSRHAPPTRANTRTSVATATTVNSMYTAQTSPSPSASPAHGPVALPDVNASMPPPPPQNERYVASPPPNERSIVPSSPDLFGSVTPPSRAHYSPPARQSAYPSPYGVHSPPLTPPFPSPARHSSSPPRHSAAQVSPPPDRRLSRNEPLPDRRYSREVVLPPDRRLPHDAVSPFSQRLSRDTALPPNRRYSREGAQPGQRVSRGAPPPDRCLSRDLTPSPPRNRYTPGPASSIPRADGWVHPELANSRPIYAAAMAPAQSYAPSGRGLDDSPYPQAASDSGKRSPPTQTGSRSSLLLATVPGARKSTLVLDESGRVALSREGYAMAVEPEQAAKEKKGWLW